MLLERWARRLLRRGKSLRNLPKRKMTMMMKRLSQKRKDLKSPKKLVMMMKRQLARRLMRKLKRTS